VHLEASLENSSLPLLWRLLQGKSACGGWHGRCNGWVEVGVPSAACHPRAGPALESRGRGEHGGCLHPRGCLRRVRVGFQGLVLGLGFGFRLGFEGGMGGKRGGAVLSSVQVEFRTS